MTSFLNYVTATLRALFAWRGSIFVIYDSFVTYGIASLMHIIYEYNKNGLCLSLITDDNLITCYYLLKIIKNTFCELWQFCELWKVGIL